MEAISKSSNAKEIKFFEKEVLICYTCLNLLIQIENTDTLTIYIENSML